MNLFKNQIAIICVPLLMVLVGCINITRPVHTKFTFVNGTENEVLIQALSTDAVWEKLAPSKEVVFDGTHDVYLKINGKVFLYKLFTSVSIPYTYSSKDYVSNRDGHYYFVLSKDLQVYFRYVMTNIAKPIALKNWAEITETQPKGFPLEGEIIGHL